MENTASQTAQNDSASEQFALDSVEMSAPENLSRGQVIEGTVVQTDSEYVWVDVNYKSEGKIDISEFETVPEENEKVTVKVVKHSGGDLIVSKKLAEMDKMQSTLQDAYENGTPVRGKVVSEAKNGLHVNFDGVIGYVPLSHMEIGPALDFENNYKGNEYDFQILKLERRGKRLSLVVSRRNLLEEKRKERASELFDTISEGDILEGEVKRITRFGVFVDLGGFDGLIQHENLAWKRGVSAKQIVKPGDKIEVKVVSLNPEKQQIGLSLKAMSENPFIKFAENHETGDVVEGKVVKLENFGAFVEVAEGVEGLLHISELSWTKRINHPKDVLQTGSIIQVQILDIDTENMRLSLGFRQLSTNPYETIDTDYPLGTKHTGKITKVNDYGIFVELPNSIEGLIRRDDISWDSKNKNYKDEFQPGQMVEVQILRIDKKGKKIGLGIKQTQENPFEIFRFNNPPGTRLKGTVKSITDFGAFVELAPNIEGLVHISQVSNKRIDKVEDVLKVGDSVNVKILDINTESGKISLSIKDYDKDVQNEMISQFKSKDDGTFKLGDMVDLSNIQ